MADDLSQWWDEDADRINKMAEAARKMAVKLPAEKEDRAWCATGPGGGLDNSCGGGAAAVVREVLKSIEKTGGFSVHPVSAKSPTTGFMCATVPHAEKIFKSSEEITEPAIQSYLDQHKDFLSENPKLHLGGWIDPDTEKVYLDLSEQFEDEAAAVAAGVKHNQLAIWDVANKREVRIRRDDNGKRQAAGPVRLPAGGGSQGDRRGPEQSSRGVARKEESRAFCSTGEGGGIDNSCGVGDGDSPSDAFGNAIDGAMRSPSSTTGGGGVRVDSGWKKSDTPSDYDSERLKSDPPARSLAEVNSVTLLTGRTLSDSLKEVGVTLDQAAKVCGNLSPESNVTIAHGTLKDITSWVDDPSKATDPESSVTVVSTQPFGGVEDAIGTTATLSRTDDDELLLSYVLFSVAPEAQKENPIAVARALYSGVVKSINEAEKAGVDEVGMLAAGSDADDMFKGYRIWPRLGFDGIIPRNKITPTFSLRLGFFERYGSNLPDEILSDRAKQEKSEGALTIQSLYDTKEGQRWWEKNGGSMGMFLRVGDNKDTGWQRYQKISSKVSERRDIIDVIDIEWRAIHGESEQRGFCPTGEGNGIDNSCGAGGAKMAPDRDMGSSVATGRVGSGKPETIQVESQESLGVASSVLGIGGVDDAVTLGGGNVRGAKVDVYADPSGFMKVSSIWPVDVDDEKSGEVFTEVSMANTPEGKVLGFEAFGPTEGSVASGANQQKVMSIISEKVAESIDAAESKGFVAVTTFAVGDAENQYKGYRLWPQFGFDADLPRDLAKKVPPEIVLKAKGIAIPPPGSTSIPHDLVVKSLASQHRDLTIQELISTREGDRWWDKHGDDIELKLDLTDKSSLGYKKWQSMKDRLPRLRERNQTRSFFDSLVEERGFCPTGEGGGILNTCGNDDGGPTDAFGGSIDGFERSPSATKEKKGGGGDSAPAEPLVWRAGEPHIDIFSESSQNNPTVRDESGKIVSTAIPGGVPTRALGGKYEIDPVSVGRYLMTQQSEERGRPISTKEELEGDDFEYMVSGIVEQARSAQARGVSPNFYAPEDRQSQLEEYSKLQPLMRGGRTASGFCLGEEDADGGCKESEGISPQAEFLFRAAQALTSPEANPYENMRRANQVLDSFFNEPDPKKARLGVDVDIAGASGDNIRDQLSRLHSIIDRIGLEETRKLLSGPPIRVGDFDEYFTSRIPNSEGESFKQKNYAVDEFVPPFSIFGPKVGPFFANNMGDPEPLTADVWFTRTWGRLSGELIEKTSPSLAKSHGSQLMAQTGNIKRSVLAEIGHDGRTFRTDVAQMKKTGVIPQSVVNWAEKQFKQAAKDGFPGPKNGTGTAERKSLDNLSKAIIKNQTRVLKAPSTTVMRSNMIRVMKEASARTGVPVAYLQDILWQDEQDAWGTLGSRTTTVPGEPSLYSTVIKELVDDIKSGKSGKGIDKKGKRSYDELGIDDVETGYLSDYKGGLEQALFDEALHDVDEATFADIAIEFLRRSQPEAPELLELFKALEEVIAESESRSAECGRDEDGKFGPKNDCQEKGGSSSGSRPDEYPELDSFKVPPSQDVVAESMTDNKEWTAADLKSNPPFAGAERLGSIRITDKGSEIQKRLDGMGIGLGEAIGLAGASQDSNNVSIRRDYETPSGQGLFIDSYRPLGGVENGIEQTTVIKNVGPKGKSEIQIDHKIVQVAAAIKADPAKRVTAAREFYRTMADSVEAARKTGAGRITLNAAGSSDGKSGFRGYTIWPRMGFDAPIPFNLKQKLPESLSHAGTLLDLHTNREGRDWWEANGRDIDVTLDLRDRSSPQNKLIDKFLKRFSGESRSASESVKTDASGWLSMEDHAKFEEIWEEIIEEGVFDDYGES